MTAENKTLRGGLDADWADHDVLKAKAEAFDALDQLLRVGWLTHYTGGDFWVIHPGTERRLKDPSWFEAIARAWAIQQATERGDE